MQQNPERLEPIAVDVVESPDGVLNVIIRPGQPKPGEGIEALRRSVRRAPKRAR